MDRDEMSNLYRGPSTFSGDDFLEINQSETRIAYGEFRRRFLKIGQSETRIACGSHVCQRDRTK